MPDYEILNIANHHYTITLSRPEEAEQLEAVQRACFPSLSEDELIRAEHYRNHIRLFPEGQLMMVRDDGKVVGCSSDFRTNVDFDHIEHRYIDAVAHNWLSNHDPQGEWLYGADIGIIPECRGLGLSSHLYRARHDLVRRLSLKGHVAGGMLVGYGAYKGEMSIETYVDKVKRTELFDPTVSVQLKRGFVIKGIIQDYVSDPSCDNKAAFIVWFNPEHTAAM